MVFTKLPKEISIISSLFESGMMCSHTGLSINEINQSTLNKNTTKHDNEVSLSITCTGIVTCCLHINPLRWAWFYLRFQDEKAEVLGASMTLPNRSSGATGLEVAMALGLNLRFRGNPAFCLSSYLSFVSRPLTTTTTEIQLTNHKKANFHSFISFLSHLDLCRDLLMEGTWTHISPLWLGTFHS